MEIGVIVEGIAYHDFAMQPWIYHKEWRYLAEASGFMSTRAPKDFVAALMPCACTYGRTGETGTILCLAASCRSSSNMRHIDLVIRIRSR